MHQARHGPRGTLHDKLSFRLSELQSDPIRELYTISVSVEEHLCQCHGKSCAHADADEESHVGQILLRFKTSAAVDA